MVDIKSIIQNGNGNIKLEISVEDLLLFSEQLINGVRQELAESLSEAKRDELLTKEDVKEICDVCDTTLWHWHKKGYLKPVKIGSKVRYKKSDLKKILGEEGISFNLNTRKGEK